MNAGLVHRKQINIKEGGYFYRYEAVPFSEVKESIKESMEKWCNDVKNWIDEIEEDEAINIVKNLL